MALPGANIYLIIRAVSLKLGIVWVFVQLIFGHPWPMNQLNKTPKPNLRLPISSGYYVVISSFLVGQVLEGLDDLGVAVLVVAQQARLDVLRVQVLVHVAHPARKW